MRIRRELMAETVQYRYERRSFALITLAVGREMLAQLNNRSIESIRLTDLSESVDRFARVGRPTCPPRSTDSVAPVNRRRDLGQPTSKGRSTDFVQRPLASI